MGADGLEHRIGQPLALATAALKRFVGIDILVHLLGGSTTPGGGFVALTDDHWLSKLHLNLLATVRLDRLLIPQMIERGSGAWCASPRSNRFSPA